MENITTNPEVIGAIAVSSTVIIGLLKKLVGKKYINEISRLVPAVLALVVAFASNYGLNEQILSFAVMGGSAHILSQAIYKIDKINVK